MKLYFSQRFELSRGGDGNNLRPMEGLRGLAVALVFLVHYVTLVSPWILSEGLRTFAEALHTIGNSGVDLFFVLSGYLIYGSLISRPQIFFKFMSRRLVRVYPAFITVLAIYLILSAAFPAENKIPPTILQGFLYVAANVLLLPGIFPIQPIITVAWSLSYEITYYLAIPLVIGVLKLRERSSTFRVGIFSISAVGILVYCAAMGGPIRLVMFISGILLYEARATEQNTVPRGYSGFLILIFGLGSALLPISGPFGLAVKTVVLFWSLFFICSGCFGDISAPLPRVFSWTPLRWLGNMSYSYYLLHGLTLKAAFLALSFLLPKNTINSALLFWGLMPAMFGATFISSAVLFLTIERPLSLGRRGAMHGSSNSAQEGMESITLKANASQRNSL